MSSNLVVLNAGHHIKGVPLESISKLAPFSGLILCIIFLVYFSVRFYLFEGFLLRRVYGGTYTSMNEGVRRGFVNHHIAGTAKIVILIMAIYPFIDVAFGSATFHTGFAGSTLVTQGDILVIITNMLIAIYVFELFYREKISVVSVLHHAGTIMIGESAIALSLNLEKDSSIEFIMILVWGAFDIWCECLPHLSIILYRVYPTSHLFLSKVFRAACITTLAGTIAETIMTFWLFGILWDRWTLSFKIATPSLFLLFATAQNWGTWKLYQIGVHQGKLAAQGQKQKDVETGGMGLSGVGDGSVVREVLETQSIKSVDGEIARTESSTMGSSTKAGSVKKSMDMVLPPLQF